MTGNKLQARYYWNYALNLKKAKPDLKKIIEEKLFNGINGLFAGMPSEKRQDENGEDKYFDTIWLTDEIRESMREKLNTMASEQYNQNNTMSAGTDATMATPKSEQTVPQTEKSDTQVEAPFSDDDLPF